MVSMLCKCIMACNDDFFLDRSAKDRSAKDRSVKDEKYDSDDDYKNHNYVKYEDYDDSDNDSASYEDNEG